jgi:hypothetical protein
MEETEAFTERLGSGDGEQMTTMNTTDQPRAVACIRFVRPLLRGYCIVAFAAVHVLHFPVFAIYWLGHLAEWIMEHVTCRAGDHIRKVWRYARRPNELALPTASATHTQP